MAIETDISILAVRIRTLIHQRVSRAASFFVRAFFRLPRPSARSASRENGLEHAAEPAFALFVFACNPLVSLEQAGNGHNDGLIVCFGLLAVLALQQGSERSAVWLAVLGTLVKIAGVSGWPGSSPS